MHDSSRRLLTVSIFLVLGPLLTAALLGAITVRKTPIAAHWEAETIRIATNRNAKIKSVNYLRPDLVRLNDVKILDPQTGNPLLYCPVVELHYDLKELPGILRKCVVEEMVIELYPKSKYEDVEKIVKTVLELPRKQLPDNLLFDIANVEIKVVGTVPEESYQLTSLRGKYVANSGKDETLFMFNMGNDVVSEPIRFTLQKTEENETTLELSSDKTVMPGKLLTLFVPGLSVLGDDFRFSGTILAKSQSKTDWTFSLENTTIRDGNLRSFAAFVTPYRATGQLNFSIKSVNFQTIGGENRFLNANGWFQIQNGTIAKDLLKKIVEQFGLIPNPRHLTQVYRNPDPISRFPRVPELPIENAIVQFDLNPSGAVFQSINSPDSGLVLSINRENNYYIPKKMEQTRVSYSDLLHSLMPVNAELVPLTPHSQRVINLLHLPAR